MMWITDPAIWASFLALTALEIVLGIDNLVFVALLANRLPPARQAQGRRIGLVMALGTRLALLWSIAWLAALTAPVITIFGHAFSWRDMILLGGGLFLLFKSAQEIRHNIRADEVKRSGRGAAGFAATIVQIMIFDVIFSLDSVITAIGIADELWVMVAAMIVSMAFMVAVAGPLAAFVERFGSVKRLMLAFLLLIGVVLVADGVGLHVPRNYIYVTMGFAIFVESLNLLAMRRERRRVPLLATSARADTQSARADAGG